MTYHLSLSTTALKIFHVSMPTFSQELLKNADLSRMQEACHMWTSWWPNPQHSGLLFGQWWSIEGGTPSLESAFDFWWKFRFFCPTLVTLPITFRSVNLISSSENSIIRPFHFIYQLILCYNSMFLLLIFFVIFSFIYFHFYKHSFFLYFRAVFISECKTSFRIIWT